MNNEIIIPEVGESITEVTIGEWKKQNEDFVEMDEIICELESEKTSFELRAEISGLLKIKIEEGETVKIGEIIGEITISDNKILKENYTETSKENLKPKIEKNTDTKIKNFPSPAASKILREKGINDSKIIGTGKDNRITKEDAIKAIDKNNTDTNIYDTKKINKKETMELENRSIKYKKMSTLRKTIAKRLVIAKSETAMLTTFNELDVLAIKTIRKKYAEKFLEKHEVKLGFMSFFTKACSSALKDFPALNAMLYENSIAYHNYCDIAIAVSTPKGLVTPVIRNTEKMSFAEIEKSIIHLGKKARDGKLTIEDMSGGTFTITNGGIFGSMLSTPIINYPQAAILGMHNIVDRPIVVNGEIKIRPIMYLALSYDHRIVDGRESVSFLVKIKQLLEDPSRLLLEI